MTRQTKTKKDNLSDLGPSVATSVDDEADKTKKDNFSDLGPSVVNSVDDEADKDKEGQLL
jgi:hypothetical protein